MTHENHRIDALPPGSELQSYIVDRVLGSGAFGITYLVKHRHLDSWHVIKEYLPDCGVRENNRSTVSPKSASDKELFDWGLKCFFDEAKLLYQLSHPHVVKVTDLFDTNGTAYFVMPYLQGFTLHEWMKNNPRPGQPELEAIFVPLLEGLKYIHDKGLLHRDIKPENIFITGKGHPVLIDFGSARLAIGQKSKALTQVLTPHFAPFEQYASKGTFTPALDLYSLAACMYQAITGDLPEEAPNRVVEDEQSRLAGSGYEKRYAGHFLQAVDKSLSVYASGRHQDGFAMQRDLVGQAGKVQRQEEFVFMEDLGVAREREVSQAPMVSSTDTAQEEPGTIWTEPFTGMEFVWVPGGTFEMGDMFGDGNDDEKPVHTVELDGFWMGKYPVTQAQWEKVIGSNPSHFRGPDNPVECVSWEDAHDFTRLLNNHSKNTGFRLPTEAEWEYAARSGGRREKFSGGDDVDKVAWYSGNSGGTPQPVGKKGHNGLGIYDMSGNVWEWCRDIFDAKAYSQPNRKKNPIVTSGKTYRVFRGGSWFNEPRFVRAVNRNRDVPSGKDYDLGFRLVRNP